MEQHKNRLAVFKYNAILSIIFFFASTLYLSNKIPDFSFSKYTISQMSYFLDQSQMSFFSILFFVKCLLDLSFTLYVFKYFKLFVLSPTAVSWLIAIFSFGLLGFFPTSQFRVIHVSIVIIMFFFWTLSEYLFAKMVKDIDFLRMTNRLLIVQMLTIFLFVLTKNFNGIFEIIYLFLVFFWLIVFINRFLK